MGIFSRFSIPPKEPDTLCNARVRDDGGQEAYCNAPVPNAKRCPEHNLGEQQRAIREEAELSRLDNLSLEERAAKLSQDKRIYTDLTKQILHSAAVIEEMERRHPITAMSGQTAIELSRLRAAHAELIASRVDLEVKMKALFDTDWLWGKANELFEKKIADANTKQIVVEEFGKLLDELVAHSDQATAE